MQVLDGIDQPATIGSNRKPLPKLPIQGYDSVPLYQSGNHAARPYGFGFVVTCGWLEQLSIEKGICQPGEGNMCGGLKYICDQIGMEHYSSVRLRPKNDPTMPTLAYLVWIANNLTSWGMEMANDREMVEKLKATFDTDMEPKWYRSGLGGCPLKRPKQKFGDNGHYGRSETASTRPYTVPPIPTRVPDGTDQPTTIGSHRKPLPKLPIQAYDSVPLYQSGNRIARPYGFGFVVTCGWLEQFSVEKGICQPGEGNMCGGLKYICDQIGMEHYSSVRLRPKNDPTMPTLAYLIWIANNLTSWGMEMANDREMVEKLKTALDTDMEPKWYRSGLGGCPLKRPKQT